MEKKNDIWQELQKRHVFRVIIPYVVVALFITLISDLAIEYFGGPDWVLIGVEILLIVLFPVSLILAWHYEMSPDGFVHVLSEDAKKNPYKPSKKKPMTGGFIILFWILLIIILTFLVKSF